MNNKKNVGILIFNDVDILDFSGPYEVFHRTRTSAGIQSRLSIKTAPFRVFTVAKKLENISVSGGLKIKPDFNFKDSPKIDILLIPGGMGTRKLLNCKVTIKWIKEHSKKTSWLPSGWTGSLLLAKAEVLKNRKATTHWGALDLLKEISPSTKVIKNKRVVNDGIITAAGVSSGIDMAFNLVEILYGKKVVSDTAKYIEYNRSKKIVVN